MSRQYRYFSADSHFESLPETWTHRVPAKFRERAPRRIKLADGRDAMGPSFRQRLEMTVGGKITILSGHGSPPSSWVHQPFRTSPFVKGDQGGIFPRNRY